MILARIKQYIDAKGISVAAFEKSVGMSNASFGKAVKKNGSIGTDKLENILSVYSDLSPSWVLTGNGDMLLTDASTQATATHEAKPHRDAIPAIDGTVGDIKPIPLVTEQAAAGFGNQCFAIQADDVKDYYVIPKFRFSHVDFMIEVCGLSMYPHFKSGDVIACTVLHDAKFIQWNRCHVIATRDQGILVKRIMPSEHDDCFKIVSDNKDYPPFDLPLDEITGIALVVGSVSLE